MNKPIQDIISLTQDLTQFVTGVVAVDNEAFFSRIQKELPFRIYRTPSNASYNGWIVPQLWTVKKAMIHKNGKLIFDGTCHPLGVAFYSKSFRGELDLKSLKLHLVTQEKLPHAHVFHCMWQYRPWDADWAFCIPYEIYQDLGPGQYQVELKTHYKNGEMLVADYEHKGKSDQTIVFNAHTCHPCQANDDFAGVALLIRLFQWLQDQKTHYSYKLVLGPEHLGTTFYLKDKSKEELNNMVAGAFAEMPGTEAQVRVASTFLGKQIIDKAFSNAVKHNCKNFEFVPWRQGVGNDETVWEAPGYEIPFVEISRSKSSSHPYPEYHTSLDTINILNKENLEEFFQVFKEVIFILENNATLQRKFDGLICLSNPGYNLYFERHDPSVNKRLNKDDEKWGYFLNFLLRYFDGSISILDIAEKHDLPFQALLKYLTKYREKDLVDFKFSPVREVENV